MADGIRDFKDLIVWRKAMAFAKEIYRLPKFFPKEEQYGLVAQIRRAAVSVPSNIAEGHTRHGHEFCHFLSINAKAPLTEVECQLLLAVELGYLNPENLTMAQSLICEIPRMAISLGNKLR